MKGIYHKEHLEVGTVETLPAGSSATASIQGAKLNLGIPQGIQGVRGESFDEDEQARILAAAESAVAMGEQFRDALTKVNAHETWIQANSDISSTELGSTLRELRSDLDELSERVGDKYDDDVIRDLITAAQAKADAAYARADEIQISTLYTNNNQHGMQYAITGLSGLLDYDYIVLETTKGVAISCKDQYAIRKGTATKRCQASLSFSDMPNNGTATYYYAVIYNLLYDITDTDITQSYTELSLEFTQTHESNGGHNWLSGFEASGNNIFTFSNNYVPAEYGIYRVLGVNIPDV